MTKKYKPDSIERQMITEIIKVRQDDTIKDIFSTISKGREQFKVIDYIYVIDKNKKLLGVISINEIFNYSKNTRLDKIMKKELITISPDAKEEKAAHLALKHGIKAVPVVKNGVLLGAVPAKKLISILNRSLHKNILHFAGIHKSHLTYENTTDVPLFLSVVHRIPWLIIGLVGIMIAASFISLFEPILKKYLELAFFIPAIVYMSSALGTQHQILFVRDLTVLGKELNVGGYFLKQTFIAGVIGLFISGLTFLTIFFIWKKLLIGFVISISLFAALMVTNFTSLITTLILYRSGRDPALGSGPFATVLSDLTSIIIYFIIASWLLL